MKNGKVIPKATLIPLNQSTEHDLESKEEVVSDAMSDNSYSFDKEEHLAFYKDEQNFKDKEFILRRVNGESLNQICRDMKMSKSTASAKCKKYQEVIKLERGQNLAEKLREKEQTIYDRIDRSFDYRHKIEKAIEAQLSQLKECPLPVLFKLLAQSNDQISKLEQKLTFVEIRDSTEDKRQEEVKKRYDEYF